MALFNNVFQVTDAPEHMVAERRKRIVHDVQTFALATFLLLLGLYVTPMVVLFLKMNMGFGQQSIHVIARNIAQLFSNDPLAPHRQLLYDPKFVPGYLAIMPGQDYPQAKAIVAYILVGTCFMTPGLLRRVLNPHKRMVMKADASWCDEAAMRQMEARRQVGIKGGRMLNLGLWPKGLRTDLPVQLIEALSVLCLAPPGTGKCLGVDETVLMYDGTTKRNGDLIVGDLLMGPDSRPRRVLFVNPGSGPMFRIVPNKGRTWTCNEEHILSLRCSKAPRNRSVKPKRGDIQFVTVGDWNNATTEQRGKWKQWRAAVDFANPQEPLIDPYLIGLILGDGSTVERVGIQTAEPEIVTSVYEHAAAHELGIRPCPQPQATNKSAFYDFTAGLHSGPNDNRVCNAIRAYGLHVTCASKFIPHPIKTGTRATRLAVLAGILDADGSYDPRCKIFDLVSKSKRLIDDVTFVVRSLGMAAYAVPCEKPCTKNGVTGQYHRVNISGELTQIPVKLTRREALPRLMNKDLTNTGFRIESIGHGNWHGIVLDGDHQFLLDDFTVTHNTAGCVVPSILSSDNMSIIANDPKPEIWSMVGHWREQVSHNIVLNWSQVDTSRVVLDENGKPIRDGNGYLTDHVFHPRFNFLSKKLVPPPGANRDTYFDSIAKVMIPDKSTGDTYFSDKGRALTTGFFHYLAAKVNDRPEGDPMRYKGLPAHWHGKEASIPMLVDLIAFSQFNIGKKTETEEDTRDPLAGQGIEEQATDNGNDQTDALGKWMEKLAEEMNPNGKTGDAAVGTSARAFTEFTPLIRMADKERSGVIGTMDQAMLAFKNEAVRQRTEACDFTPDDLRGIFDEKTQTWKPVSLFVCVNQAEAEAFSTVTALLYEVLSRYLLSYGPNEVNEKTGRKLGPYPVCFVLDEFAKLAKVPAVIDGPDLGRSKSVLYLLAAQDYAQIKQKYSEENVQTLNTTTAVKYILPQNNKSTIDLIIGMVGKTTIRRGTHSYQEGVHKDASPFKWSRNDTAEETDFLRPVDIAGMKPGEHIVLVQNFLNRPIKLKTDMFYNNPEMRKKVHSRGKGPKPTKLIPDHVYQARLGEHRRRVEVEAIRQNLTYKAVEDTMLSEEEFDQLPL